MSNVLLDFVDRLVGGGGDDDFSQDQEEMVDTSVWMFASNETGGLASSTMTTFDNEYEYCSIPTEIFQGFSAEEFRNTKIIEWMHSVPPRFGKTKDVLDLIIGTEQQQQEYVLGLMASCIALLFFFLGWAVLLLLFKFLAPASGSNSTRWLGGQPLRMPSPPLGRKQQHKQHNNKHYTASKGETEEFKEWKRDYNATKAQLISIRIVVWVAGLSIAISALVMSVYGVDSLSNTLEAGRESLEIVKNLAGDAQTIVDSVIRQNKDLSNRVYGMLESVNGICPKVKDPLCDNIYDIETCDIASFLGSDLNDVFQMAAGHFTQGEQSEYYVEIVNAKNGLEDVQSLSQDMDRSASHLNWALTLSMVMSLLLAIMCLLILCGLVCPDMPRVLCCLQSKLMVPTFVVLVFFAYVFSLLFVTASVVTADVCIYHNAKDNIDERILSVLTKSQDVKELLGGQETQNLVKDFIGFYIHQCPVELLPQEILDQLQYVKAGVPVIQQFSTIVEQSTDLIQGVCGFQENQTQSLVDVADTLQDQLCAVADILSDVRDFIQCDNWFPLYENTVYEALCYDGTEGFAYVATTQFVITFMAFVILTFRVAFWDIQVGDQYYNFLDDSEGSDSDTDSRGGSEEQQQQLDVTADDKHHYYYKGLYDKITARRSFTMEKQMEQLRQSQLREREERQRATAAAAAARTTTAAGTTTSALQSLLGLRLSSSLDITAPATNSASLSSSSPSSFEEDPPPEAKVKTTTGGKGPRLSRNSHYPSRFPGNGNSEGSAASREEFPSSSLQSQTFIGGAVTAFEGENGGIEVEHLSSGGSNNNSCNYNNSNRHRPSHAVDATSLWVRQHQDNIEYHDSDDDDCKNYSIDCTDMHWSGKIVT